MPLKRLLSRFPRRLSAQVLYVFLAFAVMTAISYLYVSKMERSRLVRDAEGALHTVQTTMTAEFREREAVLDTVAETVQIMVRQGESYESMRKFFGELSEYVRDEGTVSLPYARGFFGALSVYDYRLLSSGPEPPDGYDVTSRPWYTAGAEAGGATGYTLPYQELITGIDVVSYCRQVFDDDGNPMGVIALNVEPKRARTYAIGLQLAEGGYGMLLSPTLEIIAHPNADYIDKSVREANENMLPIADELRRTGKVTEREFVNYQGERSVVFFETLDNGWYVGVVTPKSAYYSTTEALLRFLILIGAILAVALSIVLLRIVALKARADERSKIMFEAMPTGTFLCDGDGRVLDCNQEALNLFGLTKKEDFYLHFYRFSPEKQPNGGQSRALSRQYSKVAFEEGRTRFEWLHQDKDEVPIPCEVTLIRVEMDNAPYLCAYLHDLRELKAAAEKLREADERTQIMLDATPLCCTLINRDLQIIDCNNEAVNLFELSSKQEFIERFPELSPEFQPGGANSMEVVRQNMESAFERGQFRTEFVHQTLGGEQIPTEIILVKVKSRDEYILAGYIRDLRQLKMMVREMQRIEIAEESNKVKSKFVATMSHEMRTPLNAILGITEMQLMDDSLPFGAREAFGWVYNSGHTLLHIINDILNLSKIEAGKMELLPSKYDTASMINDSAQLNLMQRGSKPIEFLLDADPDIPAVLYGDDLRIKQVLGNLLSNAFKYTEKGTVTLYVSAESNPGDMNIVLLLRVTDTGIGMTPEQTETLFDAYSRFTTEHNRHSEGTGLGMNITQNLVHMMKGTIGVESTPGVGTVFTVRLPQIRVGNETLGEETVRNLRHFRINPSAKLQRFTREYMPYGHILIVDDVESNAYVARGLMSPYGLSVETALSGSEAIGKVVGSGRVYDIIFMDHMMPKMDGIEATKRLRLSGYKKPIVALTANAVSGQSEMFLKNGFDDYITKPIDTRQLDNILNKLVRDAHPPEVVEAARKQKSAIEEEQKTAELDPELARIFARDAGKAAKALRSVCQKDGAYSEEDILLFIINVHAMKSALASIGQPSLSAFALRLETAVRARDTSVIQTEAPVFIDKLLELADDLAPEETGSAAVIDTDLLRKKLRIIAAACGSYDKKHAKDALNELRKHTWTPEINQIFNEIAEHLLHSAFEEAGILAEDTAENY
ncbi:MAG: response regulator [Oscillospiraceae bacterium]|jgi:PAS domain S-box-containing protein|nr:response regulator [Oscillospiraceae bacterium]